MTEYLRFNAVGLSASGKTRIVDVCLQRTGVVLGQIRWFGRWRQYCFYPDPGMIFNSGCMWDIIVYMERMGGERRERGTL